MTNNLEDNFETLSELPLHRNSYSTNDTYCRFQRGCEGYTELCKMGIKRPGECDYADDLIIKERIKQQKGRKM